MQATLLSPLGSLQIGSRNSAWEQTCVSARLGRPKPASFARAASTCLPATVGQQQPLAQTRKNMDAKLTPKPVRTAVCEGVQSAKGLADLLGISLPQARALQASLQTVTAWSPERLQTRMVLMGTSLGGASMAQVARMICRQPAVLTLPLAALPTQTAHLAALLDIPLPHAADLLTRQPQALTAAPERYAAKAKQLAFVLDVPLPQGALALSRLTPSDYTRMMCAHGEELVEGRARLGRVLGCSDKRRLSIMLQLCPALLLVGPPRLRAARDELAAATCLSRPHIMHMLLRSPGLLLAAPGAFSAAVHALQGCMGLSDAASVGQRAAECPNILKWGPAALDDKVHEVQAALGMGPGQVARLLRNQPALLGMSADQLQAKLHGLAQLLGEAEGGALADGVDHADAGAYIDSHVSEHAHVYAGLGVAMHSSIELLQPLVHAGHEHKQLQQQQCVLLGGQPHMVQSVACGCGGPQQTHDAALGVQEALSPSAVHLRTPVGHALCNSCGAAAAMLEPGVEGPSQGAASHVHAAGADGGAAWRSGSVVLQQHIEPHEAMPMAYSHAHVAVHASCSVGVGHVSGQADTVVQRVNAGQPAHCSRSIQPLHQDMPEPHMQGMPMQLPVSRLQPSSCMVAVADPCSMPGRPLSVPPSWDINQDASHWAMPHTSSQALQSQRAAAFVPGYSVLPLQPSAPLQQARLLAVRQPALLCIAPATLQAKWAGLRQLLAWDDVQMRHAVQIAPTLLTLAVPTVAERLHALEEMLDASTQEVHAVVHAEPRLLAVQMASLMHRMRYMCKRMGVRKRAVQAFMRAHPTHAMMLPLEHLKAACMAMVHAGRAAHAHGALLLMAACSREQIHQALMLGRMHDTTCMPGTGDDRR